MKTSSVLIPLLFGVLGFLVSCKKSEQPSTPSTTTSGSAATAGAAAAPASGRVVEITANDTMKFSIAEIRAKPGETLSVTLKNIGNTPKFSMGHNFVVLKKPELVEAFIQDAPTAATTDYIPPSHKDDILAHTKLLGPKESDTVTFNAPSSPGHYPFLCSFPGHYQVGMKGELIVE